MMEVRGSHKARLRRRSGQCDALQPPRRNLAQRCHSAGKETKRASRTDDASNAEITTRTLRDSANAIRSYRHRDFMVDVDKPSEDMLKERKTGMWRRELVYSLNWSCISVIYECLVTAASM